jgi:predicted nucleic acid-binding protein
MEKKIKLYLDTSVISALFDHRNPERQNLTKAFFDEIRSFRIFISVVTLVEVERTPDVELREKMEDTLMGHNVLSLTDDIKLLAKEYIKNGAVPENYEEDAYHIAIAVLNDMDYLLSWNFKHLVRQKTRSTVNMVNTNNKLKKIEIITPAEIL